jgi:hypothetical protein
MRALMVSALLLFAKCDSFGSFLELPFDVDWRESMHRCLDSQRPPVERVLSFPNAVEELMSIKVCIESKGTKNTNFSLRKTIKCESSVNPIQEKEDYLKWAEEKGIEEENCFSPDKLNSGKCDNKCKEDITKRVFAKDIKKFNYEGKIMQEILFSGPVLASFDLYSDFLEYKGGMYTHKNGEYLGKHTVILIGYIRDGEYQIWIAKNSFGPAWGENGYFKIPFDHLNICENVTTFSPLYKYQ